MERIEREYAIIYIDRNGETLNISDSLYKGDYVTAEMVSDYYKRLGFLQWNFYLIIPKELIKQEEIKTIEDNDIYTRKYVIESDKIEQFINDRFPILNEERGTIKLIKADSWKDAGLLAEEEKKKGKNYVDLIQSFYRDENLMYSLTEMDKLRAGLIKNPKLNIVFYTHISDEFFIAENKFKLFQIDK